jgi:hypothetical protein
MIKIDFEFETPHGKFADALHLPEDHTFNEAEIQAMKEQRRDSWIAVVTAPSPEPEINATVEIAGEVYQKLEGVPPSGAKLVEVEGIWYYKE